MEIIIQKLLSDWWMMLVPSIALLTLGALLLKSKTLSGKLKMKAPFVELEVSRAHSDETIPESLLDEYVQMLVRIADAVTDVPERFEIAVEPVRSYIQATCSQVMNPPISLNSILANPLCPRLLITGSPGAGKSTALLEIAQGLARRESPQPSVLLQCSNWNRGCASLEQLIEEQMRDSYNISPAVAKLLVKKERLALLFDGLDEIVPSKQKGFAEAFNTFVQHHGLTQIVICSQQSSLETSPTLNCSEAVRLLPLADTEISSYLVNTNRLEILALLDKDNDLFELCHNPLFLKLLSELSSDSTIAITNASSDSERVAVVIGEYIKSKLPSIAGSPEKTLSYLHWLAQTMSRDGLTEFLVERIQPSILPSDIEKLVYLAMTALFVSIASSPYLLTLAAVVKWLGKATPPTGEILFWGLPIGMVVAWTNFNVRPYGQLDLSKARLKSLLRPKLFWGICRWFFVPMIFSVLAILASFLVAFLVFGDRPPDNAIEALIFACLILWLALARHVQKLKLLDDLSTTSKFAVLTLASLGTVLPLICILFVLVDSSGDQAPSILSVIFVTISTFIWVDRKLHKTDTKHHWARRLLPVLCALGLATIVVVCFGVADDLNIDGQTLQQACRSVLRADFNEAGRLFNPAAVYLEPLLKGSKPIVSLLFVIGNIASTIWTISYVMQLLRGADPSLTHLPNEGITRSLKNSLVCGLLGGALIIAIGLIIAIPSAYLAKIVPFIFPDLIYTRDQIPMLILVSFLQGVTVGSIVSLLPVAQHFILRVILWHERAVPFKLVAFMDSCVRARLFIRVGGSYRFMHQSIADCLCNKASMVSLESGNRMILEAVQYNEGAD
jgi:hypothetical protein